MSTRWLQSTSRAGAHSLAPAVELASFDKLLDDDLRPQVVPDCAGVEAVTSKEVVGIRGRRFAHPNAVFTLQLNSGGSLNPLRDAVERGPQGLRQSGESEERGKARQGDGRVGVCLAQSAADVDKVAGGDSAVSNSESIIRSERDIDDIRGVVDRLRQAPPPLRRAPPAGPRQPVRGPVRPQRLPLPGCLQRCSQARAPPAAC